MSSKYDQIGTGYNQTRKADSFIAEKIYGLLVHNQNGEYLDVGCGTGNYTVALAKMGVQITGMDPSIKMLNVARNRSNSIDWIQGLAENIPIKSDTIDGIICSLTVHHWSNLKSSFKELSRVLKPKGRVVIFTSTPEQMKGYWLNHYFPKMLQDSIQQMPSYEVLQSVIQESGLSLSHRENYEVQSDLQDLFLYAGKHNPLLYLDVQVRNGISSFSSLANKEEVTSGLKRLKSDIDSDKISEIINKYSNDLGDYSFIVAQIEL